MNSPPCGPEEKRTAAVSIGGGGRLLGYFTGRCTNIPCRSGVGTQRPFFSPRKTTKWTWRSTTSIVSDILFQDVHQIKLPKFWSHMEPQWIPLQENGALWPVALSFPWLNMFDQRKFSENGPLRPPPGANPAYLLMHTSQKPGVWSLLVTGHGHLPFSGNFVNHSPCLVPNQDQISWQFNQRFYGRSFHVISIILIW